MIEITPDIALDEGELGFSFIRASGPGGQKRNKTSSAVRITHEPSGISAIANESRSQAENRRRALFGGPVAKVLAVAFDKSAGGVGRSVILPDPCGYSFIASPS